MKQRTVLATILATTAATGGCSSSSGSKEDREALLCIVNLVGCALNHAFRPSATTSHAGGDGGEFRPWDSSLGERMDRRDVPVEDAAERIRLVVRAADQLGVGGGGHVRCCPDGCGRG